MIKMEILNTISIDAVFSPTMAKTGAIYFGILAFAMAIAWALAKKEHKRPFAFAALTPVLFVMCIVSFCVGFFHSGFTYESVPAKKIHEVQITDPNYVIDAQKYKIIEKRGNILVIEDIKWEEGN
jgi:hypothetical protein